jgi:hypothetical protein
MGIGSIGCQSLLTSERVDLAHQMSLGWTTNAAVASHLSNSVNIYGQ